MTTMIRVLPLTTGDAERQNGFSMSDRLDVSWQVTGYTYKTPSYVSQNQSTLRLGVDDDDAEDDHYCILHRCSVRMPIDDASQQEADTVTCLCLYPTTDLLHEYSSLMDAYMKGQPISDGGQTMAMAYLPPPFNIPVFRTVGYFLLVDSSTGCPLPCSATTFTRILRASAVDHGWVVAPPSRDLLGFRDIMNDTSVENADRIKDLYSLATQSIRSMPDYQSFAERTIALERREKKRKRSRKKETTTQKKPRTMKRSRSTVTDDVPRPKHRRRNVCEEGEEEEEEDDGSTMEGAASTQNDAEPDDDDDDDDDEEEEEEEEEEESVDDGDQEPGNDEAVAEESDDESVADNDSDNDDEEEEEEDEYEDDDDESEEESESSDSDANDDNEDTPSFSNINGPVEKQHK